MSKGYKPAVAMADRHYSRQTIGALQFTRPGQNIVLMTTDHLALWASWRPRAGIKRMDGLEAIECTIFRNEGPHLSSELIREAVALTVAKRGWPPDGVITYVKPSAVRSENPGACFRKAGFKRDKRYAAKKDLIRLTLKPIPDSSKEQE